MSFLWLLYGIPERLYWSLVMEVAPRALGNCLFDGKILQNLLCRMQQVSNLWSAQAGSSLGPHYFLGVGPHYFISVFDETFHSKRLTSRTQTKITASSSLTSLCSHTDQSDNLVTKRPPTPFCWVVRYTQFLIILYICCMSIVKNLYEKQKLNHRREKFKKMVGGRDTCVKWYLNIETISLHFLQSHLGGC